MFAETRMQAPDQPGARPGGPVRAPGFITGDSQGLEVEPEWEPFGVTG